MKVWIALDQVTCESVNSLRSLDQVTCESVDSLRSGNL